MGFLTGSTSFSRYRIVEDPTGQFGDEHLKTLKKFGMGGFQTNLFEQSNIGFTGGAHLLDADFRIEKNIVGDAMHFGVRADSCQIPSPIKKAWLQMELDGMMADHPESRPTKIQRKEAKDSVETRCAEEATKGNYLRMNETPILWDAASDTIFVGSTSEKSNDICVDLLERAFGLELSPLTSGRLALEFAEEPELYGALQDIRPTSFLPDDETGEITWWNGMAENFDYLGNEFLLWLWWQWDSRSDTCKLSDGSELTGMFARSLSLDCPRDEFGKETISSVSPVCLPEALLAIRMGKLPRKAGLTLVRNGEQYDLTLQAETLAINGARISYPGDSAPETKEAENRIESIRQLVETVDLLFDSFCEKRIGKGWPSESRKIIDWLQNGDNRKKKRAA